MKTNNWIVYSCMFVCSLILLIVWYTFGFNLVDSPFDFYLTFVWWVLIALAIFIVIRVEEARKRRIRTVYVSNEALFNPEKGVIPCKDKTTIANQAETTITSLKYNFESKDLPNKDKFPISCIIRTSEFKENKNASQSQASTDTTTWKGQVVLPYSKEERPFEDKTQLIQILSAMN